MTSTWKQKGTTWGTTLLWHIAVQYRIRLGSSMVTHGCADRFGLSYGYGSSVLEFVCLPWSEVCSARVTSLLLLWLWLWLGYGWVKLWVRVGFLPL